MTAGLALIEEVVTVARSLISLYTASCSRGAMGGCPYEIRASLPSLRPAYSYSPIATHVCSSRLHNEEIYTERPGLLISTHYLSRAHVSAFLITNSDISSFL